MHSIYRQFYLKDPVYGMRVPNPLPLPYFTLPLHSVYTTLSIISHYYPSFCRAYWGITN